MPYEQIQSGLTSEEERRKRLRQQIIESLSGMGETEMVSGRAVPTSPLTGLSKIGQALLMQRGLAGSEEETKQLMGQQETEKQSAIKDVMNLYKGVEGQPQAGGPLRYDEGQDYQGFKPAVEGIEADPMQAALLAASSPYTKDMSSILSSQIKGTGSQSRPIATSSGYYQETDKGWQPMLDEGGQPLMAAYADPALQGNLAYQRAAGGVTGESSGQAQVDLPATEIKADETTRLVDELLAHPGLEDVVGLPDNPLVAKGLVPGTEAADFRTRLNQLTGRTFMEVFPTLKGGGQITEIEGQKAQESINRMSSATSEEGFRKAASDFKKEVAKLKELVRSRATGTAAPVQPSKIDIESLLQKY